MPRWLRRLFCVVLATAVVGCGGDFGEEPAAEASVCATGFIGDRSAEPRFEIRALAADGRDVLLSDDGDLAIVTPPQGGRVAFVGVRATNVDGCGIQIFTTLRDPVSGETRDDARTVNLLRAGDGSGTSGPALTNIGDYRELGSYSHVALCPNRWAAQDVFDAPFDLEVRVVDRAGRTATRNVRVTPRCADDECRCICKTGYVFTTDCGGAGTGG